MPDTADPGTLKIDLASVIVPGDRMLVRQLPPETQQGLIVLPDQAQRHRMIGQIVRLGAGVPADWPGREGDYVDVGRYAMRSTDIEEFGKDIRVVSAEDVLVVIPKEVWDESQE